MVKRYVKKFSSFSEEQDADDLYYANLSIQERLDILIQLIGHKEPEDGAIQRSVRIYPVTESE